MPYVHRDEDGRISGIFEVLQIGYAEEWLDEAAIEPLPAPYQLYRSVFIRRMSEQEVLTMEAVLQNPATPAKLRMMFYAVDYFVSDDPLFAQLSAAVAATLGEERAGELLAPDQ
ncbi:hypothetical protein [Paradevosia shaoguanensis]|uniref:hypothetical protein n=1 Tax=Paradevosia shaoguanensis TaxID=1335043 RepID=UPI001933BC92|nr:hypothetical protein [Paradevosia shaoguanensis]